MSNYVQVLRKIKKGKGHLFSLTQTKMLSLVIKP